MVTDCPNCKASFIHAEPRPFNCPACQAIVRHGSGLTLREIQQLGCYLEGTAIEPNHVLENGLLQDLKHLEGFAFDLVLNELEDDLLFANIERCSSCSWWMECCFLDADQVCDDCQSVFLD